VVDATIRIRGVCWSPHRQPGQMQEFSCWCPRSNRSSGAGSGRTRFSLPVPADRPSLLQLRGPREVHSPRARLRVLLTFREGRSISWQDASGAAMAVAQEDVVLEHPGWRLNWMFGQSAHKSDAAGEVAVTKRRSLAGGRLSGNAGMRAGPDRGCWCAR